MHQAVLASVDGVTHDQGRRWIGGLPEELSAQRRLLHGLLDVCERVGTPARPRSAAQVAVYVMRSF